MKKLVFIISLFILTDIVQGDLYSCDALKHKQACVSQLANGFTFIKSYLLEGGKINAKGEIEYSFVFSKGTNYMLTMANNYGEATNIEIKLFDPSHKLIVSNFDSKSGKFFPISYPCQATGIHYMSFSFKGGADKCGVSVLGFKRG